jgi:hypothetical protein
MPRIPLIPGGAGAAVYNAPRIPALGGSPTVNLESGLSDLSKSLQSIADRVLRQKEDLEFATTRSLYTAQTDLLKDQVLSDPSIDNPTQAFKDREEELRTNMMNQIKLPGVKQAFEVHTAAHLPLMMRDVARGELALQTRMLGAETKRTVDLLSNDAAGTVTNADREAVTKQVEQLLVDSVGRKALTPEQGEMLLKKHHEKVDSAWATRRAIADPIGTAEDLQAGNYPGIPQDRAERLAVSLFDRAKRDQEQQARKAEHDQNQFNKWFNDQKTQKETELTIQAGAGTLSLEQLNQDAKDWFIHPEQYRAIKSILDKPDKKEQSDPDTLTSVSIDSNSGKPKMSLSTLAKLRESGLLNQADFDRESQKRLVLQREDAAINRGEAALDKANRNYDFTRAKELLQVSLGIPTMFEKLDPTTKKLWAAALTELDTRASSVSGKEQASVVVYDIIKRYAPQMDQQARLDANQLDGTMRYKTWADLEANKSKISRAEYDNASSLLLRMDELRKAVEARNAAKAAEQPKPGGILDWFKWTPKENQPGSQDRKPK